MRGIVQMWALNPERNSPDQVVKPADKVAIGHKYQLRATDNFRYLAVQFATTRGFSPFVLSAWLSPLLLVLHHCFIATPLGLGELCGPLANLEISQREASLERPSGADGPLPADTWG